MPDFGPIAYEEVVDRSAVSALRSLFGSVTEVKDSMNSLARASHLAGASVQEIARAMARIKSEIQLDDLESLQEMVKLGSNDMERVVVIPGQETVFNSPTEENYDNQRSDRSPDYGIPRGDHDGEFRKIIIGDIDDS